MQDEYSDILGTGALNVKPKSSIPLAVKVAFVSFALLVLYIVGLNAWSKFLKWRERSYRLAMRRKHGIPDDDHRPFNVAYAASQRARQEREALRSAKSRPMNNVPREQPRPSAQLAQDLRQRTGISRNVETARMGDRIGAIPGAYRQPTPQNIAVNSIRYNQIINGQPAVYLNDEKVIYPRATELVSHTNYASQGTARVFRGQNDSRRRNHVYMDIDEGSSVAENSGGRQTQFTAPKRGSKREFGDADETDDVVASKRAREKRARKVSLEKGLSDDEMEVDENELEDGVDRGHISRGKKRDRDEAGSTFGCDDEDQSELEEIQDDDETRPRSRKRRSVVKKKSDLAVAIRGKKRDRDIDDEVSEDASDQASNQTSSRKRRNKREGGLDEYLNGDISMDDSPVKGKSRKIGEEWTSNGVMYKIGPNGQRLRQTLVKRARQKYSMPEDSQHPDRDANLEVYVETWLNEDEYQDAKEQHLLAWQDTPKASVERGAISDHTQPPPSPSGKSLLWKSPAVSTPEGGSPTSEAAPIPILKPKGRVAHDPRRQSIAVDVALRVNPFQQYPTQTNRRIASGSPRIVSGASSPGLVDSTNSSPRSLHRVYSKWEKQDLEASAMMKMREAARKKEVEEKERLEKERVEKQRVEREKAEKEKAAAPPPVPTITVTKPPDDKPLQAEQKAPDFFAKPAEPAKEAAKPAVQPSPFSFKAPEAKTAAPTASPTPSFPAAAPAASTSPFSFAKPGPTPFMPAKPAGNTTKPSEQGSKPSSFAMPQSSSARSTMTSPTPPAMSLFSFPKPAAQPEQKQPDSSVQAGGASLLTRLGGAASTAAPPSAPSTFSFAKPSEAPKSFFATPSVAPSASAAQPAQSQPAPLKFDFKFKPSAPASGFPAPTLSPAPAAATEAPKPASMFSFKPADVQAPAGQSATTGASATSNFSFAFGGAPQASGDAKKDTTVSAGKSPFSFGSSNPTTSNISTSGGAGFPGFGNTQTPSTATSDAPSKPAPFGTGFGANTDIFGTGGQSSSGTKPAEPPKSNFTWPTTSSASPANSATTTTDAPKAPSAFGNVDTSAAQAAAPASSKFPFDVGGSNSLNKTGSTFAAAPTFGMSSTPSSFGGGGSGAFGFPSSTSAPSPFAPAGSGRSLFGSTSGATGNGQSALGSTNASSAPSASDAVGNAPSAATSTTSPFGSGQSMFGSTTSTPSAFGVPSGGTFSFGSTSSEKPALAFGNMASFQSTNQPAFSSTSTEKPGPTASAPVLGNIAMTNLGTPFSFESSSSSNTNGSSGGQS